MKYLPTPLACEYYEIKSCTTQFNSTNKPPTMCSPEDFCLQNVQNLLEEIGCSKASSLCQ